MPVPEDRTGEAAAPRQTLAMRLAERERQRALRAERLARLRPAAAEAATAPDLAGAADDAEAALEAFLRALTGTASDRPAAAPVPESMPVPMPEPAPAAVLHFQRPEAPPAPEEDRAEDRADSTPATDLDRLPGAGPGLVAALGRAGLPRLADVAALAPAQLAERLGPIGRLVPAEAWVAAARAAADPAGPA